MSKVLGKDKELTRIISKDALFLLPDSVFEDTTAMEYAFGDTMEILLEGGDSIFILYEDSAFAGTDSITDSLREIDYNRDIIVTLGGVTKNIAPGLFGYHIEGMFTLAHMPEFGYNYPNTWEWLAQLKPQVLRFPGGASSRFMHLLNYDRDNNGIDDKSVTGYGYDIEEIIRFYDITNGELFADESVTVGAVTMPLNMEFIKNDLEDGDCLYCDSWIAFEYIGDLEKTVETYNQQNDIPAIQPQKYIDQFIDLVDYIQDYNGGYAVEVIVDLNVFSESASQNKRIIEYLQKETNNGVTDINVVGVEMGNECNLKWAKDIMGYQEFDDYWQFINGYQLEDMFDVGGYTGEITPGYGAWMSSYYDYVFTETMQADHDFIGAFKNDPNFTTKVGITVANLASGPPSNFALKTGPQLSTYWNEDLKAHYSDFIMVSGSPRYLFDAVILHPYYEPNGNWGDIPINYYCTDYYPNNGYGHYPAVCVHETYCTSESFWDYNSYDKRLELAFEKLLGLNSNDFGNFRIFLKSRYKQSYDQQKTDLLFSLTGPSKKELWTTEWNLKDKDYNLNTEDEQDAFDQNLLTSYCNSFPHGLLIQEWFLKDLKLNFDPAYRPGFHTYSTFHSWGGGALYAMLVHADKADRLNHVSEADDEVLDPLPTPPGEEKFWLKRTMYYNFKMLSEITKNNLEYLPSNSTMFFHNPNIQPTIFIDRVHNKLYVYYSNMKGETQTYKINYGTLGYLYPDADFISFDNATIYAVDALWPYSNSGRSKLFDINTCYNTINLHPYEIQSIKTITTLPECTALTGSICVTVPAYSFGYYVIPINATSKLGLVLNEDAFSIFPNPASTKFRIVCSAPEAIINAFNVTLFNLDGVACFNSVYTINTDIDVSNFPSGVYMIVISNKEKTFTVTKKLIKAE